MDRLASVPPRPILRFILGWEVALKFSGHLTPARPRSRISVSANVLALKGDTGTIRHGCHQVDAAILTARRKQAKITVSAVKELVGEGLEGVAEIRPRQSATPAPGATPGAPTAPTGLGGKDESGQPAPKTATSGTQTTGQPAKEGHEGVPGQAVQERWTEGMKALEELTVQSEQDPFTREELVPVLVSLKERYGFKSLELSTEPSGADWVVDAEMNPKKRKKVKSEEKEDDWSIKGRLKSAGLPTSGRVRYVPPKGYRPSMPLPRGPQNGYIDRFGNEWVKGPSRTEGQAFEWDVQLSHTGREQIGWMSPDGNHVNVSLDGEVTH